MRLIYEKVYIVTLHFVHLCFYAGKQFNDFVDVQNKDQQIISIMNTVDYRNHHD